MSVAVASGDAFPVGRCTGCKREVLTHLGRDLERRCIDCDGRVEPASLRWVPGAELRPFGWAVAGEAGGCGRGGCGGGGCSR